MLTEIVASALRIIEAAGPPAALLAGGIVSLGLLVIIIAHFGGAYANVSTGVQNVALQDRLIQLVDRLAKSEERLRLDGERVEAENDKLKDRQRELLTTIELLRAQLRRVIDMLRAVQEGRLAPASIASLEDIIRDVQAPC